MASEGILEITAFPVAYKLYDFISRVSGSCL
jgi:hypothetical protein